MGGGEPRLLLSKGLCSIGSPSGPFDVVRGRVGRLRTLGGKVDLGPVDCVASEWTLDRVLDVSAVAESTCAWGTAVFYLARPSSSDDFGAGSGGEPRSAMQPQPPCP